MAKRRASACLSRPIVSIGGGRSGSANARPKASIVPLNGMTAAALTVPRADLSHRRLDAARFVQQHRPFRNVIVPFDQRWKRPAPSDDSAIKIPHAFAHRRIMGVDRHEKAGVVAGL